jgi:phosphate-selective porin OprO and OprP
MRQLEEQLQTITQELKALKEQMRAQQEAAARAAESARAAEAAAAAPRATDAAAVERAQKEAEAAQATATEAREKAAALEQQMQNTGLVRSPDGVGWQDPQGRWSVRPNGRVQLDYRNFEEPIVADTFSIRRARLGLTATWMTDYLVRLEAEYSAGNTANSTSSLTATYAYLQLSQLRPYAVFVFGQSKPQFGLENTGSASFTDFLERGFTQSLIQTLNYDRGIMVNGTPFVRGFNYGVSFTNGTGLNADNRQANAQDIKADGLMFTARVTENFAALLNQPNSVIHLGANYKTGDAANSSATPYSAASAQTEARGVTFFTPQPFSGVGVNANNISRQFQAYELALSHGPVKLQGEYWQVNYSGRQFSPAPAGPYDLDITAYYLDLMWMITGESYADIYSNGIFGRMRPRNNFDWKNRTWGAWEVGFRYSEFDASDFALLPSISPGRLATVQTLPVTVGTNQAHAYTLGVKWLLNPYTRFMLNYVQTEFETPITSAGFTTDVEKAITLRAQFDF